MKNLCDELERCKLDAVFPLKFESLDVADPLKPPSTN